MICVVHAAAIIDLLTLNDSEQSVREQLINNAEAALATLAYLDAEVYSGLARLNRTGELTVEEVDELLRRMASQDVRRVPITGELWGAAWLMRDTIAARDALYVAAARGIGSSLLATDHRGLRERFPTSRSRSSDDHDTINSVQHASARRSLVVGISG